MLRGYGAVLEGTIQINKLLYSNNECQTFSYRSPSTLLFVVSDSDVWVHSPFYWRGTNPRSGMFTRDVVCRPTCKNGLVRTWKSCVLSLPLVPIICQRFSRKRRISRSTDNSKINYSANVPGGHTCLVSNEKTLLWRKHPEFCRWAFQDDGERYNENTPTQTLSCLCTQFLSASVLSLDEHCHHMSPPNPRTSFCCPRSRAAIAII